MHMGFDHESWLRSRASADEDEWAVMDWQGLRARFLAAVGFQRALSEGRRALSGIRCGPASFDRGAAAAIAEHGQGIQPVNPVALGNDKSIGGINSIESDVVTLSTTAIEERND